MALSSEAPTGTLLASAARTATCYSEKQTNDKGYKGIWIYFDATVEVATAQVTPSIEALNPATKEWEAWLSATAITAVGETSWVIYPDGPGSVISPTDEDRAPIPYTWRLKMTHADADSLTYSVGYQYLP